MLDVGWVIHRVTRFVTICSSWTDIRDIVGAGVEGVDAQKKLPSFLKPPCVGYDHFWSAEFVGTFVFLFGGGADLLHLWVNLVSAGQQLLVVQWREEDASLQETQGLCRES